MEEDRCADIVKGHTHIKYEEARDTARRAYQKNPKLSLEKIGKDVGRSSRMVNIYISDLRAVIQSDLELNIFQLDRLGIPQKRISERLGQTRDIMRTYLGKKEIFPESPNIDLKKGFTVAKVAEKHD